MSLWSQRLKNSFPFWSKIRMDPSSNGSILIDILSEYLDSSRLNGNAILKEETIDKPWLGIGHLSRVNLDEEDYFSYETFPSGSKVYSWPNVLGDGNEVTRVDDVSKLLYGAPTRVSPYDSRERIDSLLWSSAAGGFVPVNPPEPSRLSIRIYDSTLWMKKEQRRDTNFNNDWFIRIKGRDFNSLVVTEDVKVWDDGWYDTLNIFQYIDEVEYTGFDGEVDIYWNDSLKEERLDYWYPAIFNDYEGPAFLSVEEENEVSFLKITGTRETKGMNYRRPNIEDMDPKEELLSLALLDEEGAPYDVVSFCLVEEDMRFVTVDPSGVLRFYTLEIPIFSKYSQQSVTNGLEVNMQCIPRSYFVRYGANELLATYLIRPRGKIIEVSIKRIAPDSTVEYLQSDLTWGGSLYKFRPSYTLSEVNWKEITFETLYDQFGEWEYLLTCKDDKETTVHQTKIMVGSLLPDSECITDVIDVEGIYKDYTGKIHVLDSSSDSSFIIKRDYWMADKERNAIITREHYDEVSVS